MSPHVRFMVFSERWVSAIAAVCAWLCGTLCCVLPCSASAPDDPCAIAGEQLLARFGVKDDKALKLELRRLFALDDEQLRKESQKKGGSGGFSWAKISLKGGGKAERDSLEELRRAVFSDEATSLTDNSKRMVSVMIGDQTIASAWVECLRIQSRKTGWDYWATPTGDGTRAILHVRYTKPDGRLPDPKIKEVVASGCVLEHPVAFTRGAAIETAKEYIEEIRLQSRIDAVVLLHTEHDGTIPFVIPAIPIVRTTTEESKPQRVTVTIKGVGIGSPAVEGVKVGSPPFQNERTQMGLFVGGAITVEQNGKPAENRGSGKGKDWTKDLGPGSLFVVHLAQGDAFVAETKTSRITFRLIKLPAIGEIKSLSRSNVEGETELEATIEPKP